MPDSNPPESKMNNDKEAAVLARYSQGAQACEESLCSPVSYDTSYLEVLPDGEVWILNSVEPFFVGFGPDGDVIGEHGSSGGGPAEYRLDPRAFGLQLRIGP